MALDGTVALATNGTGFTGGQYVILACGGVLTDNGLSLGTVDLPAGYLARLLARINPHHPTVLVVGAGRVTRRRAEHLLDHGVVITAWLDIDPRKVHCVIGGRPVLPLTDTPPPGDCFVLPYVSSRGAVESLSAFLERRGFRLGRSYLSAA